MSDDEFQGEPMKEAPMGSMEAIRDKEIDLLRRQIILIQDASDPIIFVGRVEIFEAMLREDIEKKKVEYDPDEINGKVRAASGLKPTQAMSINERYTVALEKFKVLYRVFKESHMPVSMEVRL